MVTRRVGLKPPEGRMAVVEEQKQRLQQLQQLLLPLLCDSSTSADMVYHTALEIVGEDCHDLLAKFVTTLRHHPQRRLVCCKVDAVRRRMRCSQLLKILRFHDTRYGNDRTWQLLGRTWPEVEKGCEFIDASQWTEAELQHALIERKLPASGSIAQMTVRLRLDEHHQRQDAIAKVHVVVLEKHKLCSTQLDAHWFVSLCLPLCLSITFSIFRTDIWTAICDRS